MKVTLAYIIAIIFLTSCSLFSKKKNVEGIEEDPIVKAYDSYLYPYKSKQGFFTASNVQVRSPINNKSVGGWEKYSKIMREPLNFFTQNNFSLDSFENLID